ncbi:GGDEF domain-containing protein [Devosia pacifica]|uniref:diguanylate cyclase n=1 Tax=Devosia pacifica TaxID=1335967 RepID=A0A918S9K7_9HYPH|nr:GGDEF domain-containing protein [Devosia pacifica]GHA27773.1 GGDEF domain-containing protein [Devosia pacifica]
MRLDLLNFSPRGLGRVWSIPLFGTLVCIAITLLVDSANFPNMNEAELRRALAVDILLPLGLAGPLLFLFMRKLRQLAIAQHELAILASTDSLTSCLNRGAFVTLVDAYLAEARKGTVATTGALLVVDADHFKGINDQFGHDYGDQALREIAASIRKVLRNMDLVGRIGGEEFAVFLPGVTPSQAEAIAERVRSGIAAASIETDEQPITMSVSVGGTHFSGPVPYIDLFRAADNQLFAAKNSGRNKVCFAAFQPSLA